VEDALRVLRASLVEGRLANQTVAVVGPEEISLAEAVLRVAQVVDKRPLMVRLPVAAHYALAWLFEHTMDIPLVASAQVRILSESVVEPLPPCDTLPPDLRPTVPFSHDQIRRGVPHPAPFSLRDCNWVAGRRQKPWVLGGGS
jgi:NADH dehydrogenase